jgi:hypothetical protein
LSQPNSVLKSESSESNNFIEKSDLSLNPVKQSYSIWIKVWFKAIEAGIILLVDQMAAVKFVFSKKATKIDEIFTVNLTLTT